MRLNHCAILFASLTALSTARPAAAPAQPASQPDFSAFHKAVADLRSTLDAVAAGLSKINTAAGTVALLNRWSDANDSISLSVDNLLKAHPEQRQVGAAPTQLAEEYSKLSRLNLDYPTVAPGLAALIRQFKDDSEVSRAFVRFRNAQVRLHNSVSGENPPQPSSR